jgi:hypothetical protein
MSFSIRMSFFIENGTASCGRPAGACFGYRKKSKANLQEISSTGAKPK